MPKTDIQALKEAIDIRELAERLGMETFRNGGQARCYNTAAHSHGDRKPSMALYHETCSYYCFACGERGDAIDLYMALEKVGKGEAIRALAKAYGLENSSRPKASPTAVSGTPKQASGPKGGASKGASGKPLRTAEASSRQPKASGPNTEAEDARAAFYDWAARQAGYAPAERYLAERGLGEGLRRRFGILALDWGALKPKAGQALGEGLLQKAGLMSEKGWFLPKGYPVLVPWFVGGRAVALQFRVVGSPKGGSPKYRFPAGQTLPLFNGDALAFLPPKAPVYVCEGALDAVLVNGTGEGLAVALPSASSIKAEWVEQLKPFRAKLLLDNDPAGEAAALKLAKALYLAGGKADRVVLPVGVKDVGEWLGG